METTSYVALSRQSTLRRELSTVANNLANLETPAFKRAGTMFVEYLSEAGGGRAGEVSFVQDLAQVRDLSPGAMQRTDNPLDLAIDGRGYFTVETEQGPRYTRNGAFQLDGEGRIVSQAGDPLLDANGNAIRLPADADRVEVTAAGAVSTEAGEIARIEPVSFEDEQALRRRAGGLYEPADGQAPEVADDARVLQGMIEGSNVQGVVEMTRLIELTRSYASAGKFTESEHERILRAVRSLVSSN